MMTDKRHNSVLIPYRKRGTEFEFYLQKRDVDAKRAPNQIGMFGGGIEEEESIEQALFREIQEELVYTPTKPQYFSRYETARGVVHVFIEEVSGDFEARVEVKEGQWGKFFTLQEAKAGEDVTLLVKLALSHVVDRLKK